MDLTHKIKQAFLVMENAERESDRTEELYSFTPDEKHEKAFDEAYKASFEATEKLVNLLCKVKDNPKVWRKVLATKRGYVRDLVQRLA